MNITKNLTPFLPLLCALVYSQAMAEEISNISFDDVPLRVLNSGITCELIEKIGGEYNKDFSSIDCEALAVCLQALAYLDATTDVRFDKSVLHFVLKPGEIYTLGSISLPDEGKIDEITKSTGVSSGSPYSETNKKKLIASFRAAYKREPILKARISSVNHVVTLSME